MGVQVPRALQILTGRSGRLRPPLAKEVGRDGDAHPGTVRRRPPGRRAGSGNRLLRFYRQVVAELRKVVWPTRKQLSTYFVVVLTFVVFVIAIVSVLDLAFGWAMFKIFG